MAIISVSLPSDGTTADVGDYNTPITTIVNAINGNLDSTNIASLSGTKLTAGTVPGTALDATTAGGYITGLVAPNTVTALGNRSYSMVFNGVDYTSKLSAGMRLRTTRTVLAPTQCTNLNGTTQYYSKTSPAGMTFTNNFTMSAWVKLSSYVANSTIASRYTAAGGGWSMQLSSAGQISFFGFNASTANYFQVQAYQSLPLNKWVHIAAQMDMTSTTNSPTVNYVMIDGVDVPALCTRAGTNPTSLTSGVGNLEIGSGNGGTNFFPGKIAQVAIYSAKVTQATILAAMHQTLAGTETSLISAYSFNNTINDLNANANNLTANGSAVATNADSPFGGQADGTISSTLDYAIIQKVAFSTNTTVTVQVPEGCTIPTSGGVSAVSYSSNAAPYGFPKQREKWRVNQLWRTQNAVASNATFAQFTGMQLIVPIGSWEPGYNLGLYNQVASVQVYWNMSSSSQTGLASTAADTTLQTTITSPAVGTMTSQFYVKTDTTLAAAATYLMYTLGATTSAGVLGTTTLCELFAENTYL